MTKNTLLAALLLLPVINCLSQDYKINFGKVVEIRNKTTDVDLLTADQSGIYMVEGRNKNVHSFVKGTNAHTAYTLIKLSNTYSEVYRKDYDKQFKNQLVNFHVAGDKIIVLATETRKKLFRIVGAVINKETGEIEKELTELGSFTIDGQLDEYPIKVSNTKNGDILVAADLDESGVSKCGLLLLDAQLKKKQSAYIKPSFHSSQYNIKDAYFYNDKWFVFAKKDSSVVDKDGVLIRRDYQTHYLSVFNKTGALERQQKTTHGSRHLFAAKFIDHPVNGLLLGGFYSKTAQKANMVDGFALFKIDPTASLTLVSEKDITSDMLGGGNVPIPDTDSQKEINKAISAKGEANRDLQLNFLVKDIDFLPGTDAFVITGEVASFGFSASWGSFYSHSGGRDFYMEQGYAFNNNEVFVVYVKNMGVQWANTVIKCQYEGLVSYVGSRDAQYDYYMNYSNYFASGKGGPYHSSYASLLYNNKYILFFNDHSRNTAEPKAIDNIQSVTRFGKNSTLYSVEIDLATGAKSRKKVIPNNSELVTMPRDAALVNNELYIPARSAKTDIKIGKISL
jgi:hypothetical protein